MDLVAVVCLTASMSAVGASILADNLDGLVRRAAIYDHMLNIGIGLRCNRGEGLAQPLGIVVVDGDDG